MRWSTIGDKIFGKIHENQEKLGMTNKFWYLLFSTNFYRICQILISGGGTNE